MPGSLSDLAAHAQKVLRPGSIVDLKRDFLCTTPISPPHGDTEKWALKAKSGIPLEGSTFDGMDKAKAESLAPLGKMTAPSDDLRSAFIKFRPVKSATDGQEGALTFDIKYANEYGQLTTTSVNVGHQIFFPKPGKVHFREMASLSVV